MRERVHYIDVCKGMMILMVIWQHAPVFAEWAGIESGELWIVGGQPHGCSLASICKHSSCSTAILPTSENPLRVFCVGASSL